MKRIVIQVSDHEDNGRQVNARLVGCDGIDEMGASVRIDPGAHPDASLSKVYETAWVDQTRAAAAGDFLAERLMSGSTLEKALEMVHGNSSTPWRIQFRTAGPRGDAIPLETLRLDQSSHLALRSLTGFCRAVERVPSPSDFSPPMPWADTGGVMLVLAADGQDMAGLLAGFLRGLCGGDDFSDPPFPIRVVCGDRSVFSDPRFASLDELEGLTTRDDLLTHWHEFKPLVTVIAGHGGRLTTSIELTKASGDSMWIDASFFRELDSAIKARCGSLFLGVCDSAASSSAAEVPRSLAQQLAKDGWASVIGFARPVHQDALVVSLDQFGRRWKRLIDRVESSGFSEDVVELSDEVSDIVGGIRRSLWARFSNPQVDGLLPVHWLSGRPFRVGKPFRRRVESPSATQIELDRMKGVHQLMLAQSSTFRGSEAEADLLRMIRELEDEIDDG